MFLSPRRLLPFLILLVSLVPGHSALGYERLERKIDRLLRRTDARTGVALLTPGGNLILRNDTLLPMLSLFKVPIALAVLDQAEREGTPLDLPLWVDPEHFDPESYSPMADSLPPEGGFVTLGRLLRYTVSESDNIACDLLLDRSGGPAATEEYLRSLGIDGIRIRVSEREMHRDPASQRCNVARPSALCRLFDRILRGTGIPHAPFLRQLLLETVTGTEKLRAGVPTGTPLGHKTGSSDRTDSGIRIADNDAGFVLLPDGRSYCIAVLVTDSRETDRLNAARIARISALAYRAFARSGERERKPQTTTCKENDR